MPIEVEMVTVDPAEIAGTTGTAVDPKEKDRVRDEAAEAEEDDGPDVWQRVPNRRQIRSITRLHGEMKVNRSRIRRRLHKFSVKKGAWR